MRWCCGATKVLRVMVYAGASERLFLERMRTHQETLAGAPRVTAPDHETRNGIDDMVTEKEGKPYLD